MFSIVSIFLQQKPACLLHSHSQYLALGPAHSLPLGMEVPGTETQKEAQPCDHLPGRSNRQNLLIDKQGFHSVSLEKIARTPKRIFVNLLLSR
jgi:hypothetical protein